MSKVTHPSPPMGDSGPDPSGPAADDHHPARPPRGGDAGATVDAASVPTHPPFRAHSIELCDVEPDDVAEKLRSMLGLAPGQPAPGEAAASYRRALPPSVQALDVGGWIAWCLVGLPLFGGGFPTLARIRAESKRVALALAIVRSQGSISAAARTLNASRKVVRDNLRAFGIYR